MPLITRRSSTRSLPRTSFGKCGSIPCHCSSLSQNKLDRISLPPNRFGSENQQAILSATLLLGCHPSTIYAQYTPVIEPLSLDEAYLDVTENLKGIASATEIAEEIRAKIRAETGLTASAGVSYNNVPGRDVHC